MKHLKMLGLVTITALGLTMFAGGSAALATTLATDAAGTIKYAAGTNIHVTLQSGASAMFKDTSGNTIATCTATTIQISTSNATGTWVPGNNTVVTQSGCSQTTDTIANGSGELMKAGTDEGEIVGKGTKVTLGVFGVSCVYGTGEGTKLGTLKGGEAPVLSVNATLPRIEGGFLCPSTGIWIGTFVVTTPHALHFVE